MIATSESYRAETAVVVPDKPFDRISWGSIMAGAVTAFSLQLVLSLIGVGVGLTTLDPATGDNPSGQAMGTGAIVWWSISALVSLFLGGYVAGRTAGTFNGYLHGMVTWAMVNLISAFLLATAVGGSLAGATGLAQFVAQQAPQWRQQAPHVAAQLEQRMQEGANQAQAAANDPQTRATADQQARQTGQEAAKKGGASAIGAAIALLLGAVAAGFGGSAGRRSFLNSTVADGTIASGPSRA
jgi:hypothetical protein